jgi:hypothetical protein
MFPWGRTLPFTLTAIAADAALFTVFALHHSPSRDAVKRLTARVVPDALVRSLYVWLASLLLVAVCAVWRPVGGDIYTHAGALAIVHAVPAAGVAIIVQTVRLIDPRTGRHSAASDTEALQIVGPYRWARHRFMLAGCC